MKVHHQFARAFWDLHLSHTTLISSDHNSAKNTCKRLRPLVPKLTSSDTTTTTTTIDLKSFIRPDGGPRKLAPPPHSSDVKKDGSPQASHQGGTRWNPTQDQIGILETLYKGGMRTPNAQQIEHITAQLTKYGKIEGKNVFYWFQNHKARERQKHKRSLLSLSPNNSTRSSSPLLSPNSSITLNFDMSKEDLGREEQTYNNSCKRKCRTWTFEGLLPGQENNITLNEDDYHNDNTKIITNHNSNEEDEEVGDKKTLKLFPLHPEGRSMMGVNSKLINC